MKSNKGKDNAESLFSIEKIPGDNQIRNLLEPEPVPASTVSRTFQKVYQWLKEKGVLKKFLYLYGEILVALDGTEISHLRKLIALIVTVVIIESFMAVSHLGWFLLIKNK